MNGIEIQACDLSYLISQVIENGKLKPMPYAFYQSIEVNELQYFMYSYGIYTLPTTELIEWLKENIVGTAIEIGCGNGAIGRALGIKLTDSKLQEKQAIADWYKFHRQPTIKYPNDVLEYDALEAIKYFKPDTVIGSFITHKYSPKIKSGNMYGVVEGKILQMCKKYIHIGNGETHRDKPILKHAHETFHFEWLITRSANQDANCICVWE